MLEGIDGDGGRGAERGGDGLRAGYCDEASGKRGEVLEVGMMWDRDSLGFRASRGGGQIRKVCGHGGRFRGIVGR